MCVRFTFPFGNSFDYLSFVLDIPCFLHTQVLAGTNVALLSLYFNVYSCTLRKLTKFHCVFCVVISGEISPFCLY